MGPELMATMRKQAERFGAELVSDDVTRVDFSEHPLKVYRGRRGAPRAQCDRGHRRHRPPDRAAQRAAAAGHGSQLLRGLRRLLLPRQARDRGRRRRSAPWRRPRFLAKFATNVTLVHRRERVPRLQDHDRLRQVQGQRRVRHQRRGGRGAGHRRAARSPACVLRDTVTGESRELAADGVFVAIGHDPTTGLFKGILDMDEAGYLLTQGRFHRHQHRGRVRRRRRGRPRLPPGRDRGRNGLHGGARRRALAGARAAGGGGRPLPARSPESGCNPRSVLRSLSMARYWICPNCGTRAIDDDGRDGLSHQPVGCAKCGFGFLFELLEDFFPPASAGFVACDQRHAGDLVRQGRVRADRLRRGRPAGQAAGRGVRPVRLCRRMPIRWRS